VMTVLTLMLAIALKNTACYSATASSLALSNYLRASSALALADTTRASSATAVRAMAIEPDNLVVRTLGRAVVRDAICYPFIASS